MYQFKLPADVTSDQIASCRSRTKYWYHTFHFENGDVIDGMYDIASNISDYQFPKVGGKRVLDVGPGSGWFSAYFEAEGAVVTSVEAANSNQFDIFGRWQIPTDQWTPDQETYGEGFEKFGPMGPSFDFIRDLLNLRLEKISALPYQIDEKLSGSEPYDLIFAGSLLMHLRDPIRALAAMRRVCRGQIIANSYFDPRMDAIPEPSMKFTGWSPILWWLPNRACLIKWFEGAGFKDVEVFGEIDLHSNVPYIDRIGRSHGKSQRLRMVRAFAD